MKHIFIIEDDPGILDALTFLLSDNYLITAIADPREAVERLSNEVPNLILVDLLMPNLNGAEFIRKLQKKKNKIPILVMTASSNVEAKLKGLDYSGIIRKPFDIQEMESRIAALVAD